MVLIKIILGAMLAITTFLIALFLKIEVFQYWERRFKLYKSSLSMRILSKKSKDIELKKQFLEISKGLRSMSFGKKEELFF